MTLLPPRRLCAVLALAALVAATAGTAPAGATPAGAIRAPAPVSGEAGSRRAFRIQLAAHGVSSYVISVARDASEPEAFAAEELARYLGRMSGASFPVVRGEAPARAIVLRSRGGTGEGYTIAVRGEQLLLTGESPRAVLYAAYDLLERLGCRWLAPELDFYGGAAEVVPRREPLLYQGRGDVVARPILAYRKLDVENGRSHDAASLRRIIEWLPKLRYNTLQVPLNYAGNGRVVWDRWRAELTPELRRRGLLLEVGGHGYQNFISARERDGALFREHPEWFGRDSSCRRSPAERLVFDTENEGAVAHVVDAVVAYATSHPEVDILDFWPPDGARWSECADSTGAAATERQARLVRRVHEALKQARPDLRLEIIAYGELERPPQRERLPADLLVDFCPINQSFDAAISDRRNARNAEYVRAIRAWRAAVPGDIGLYSYYRKYAWRSLPMVLPHYLQRDLRWYAAVPLQGISTYAEPGDWGTYELNHYALGKLAWDPGLDLDALLDAYGRARYGGAWPVARLALSALEDHYRTRASVPFSAPDPVDDIARVRTELARRRAALDEGEPSPALDRLALMLEYALQDLGIEHARAKGAAPAELRARAEALVRMQQANADRGVFLLYGDHLSTMLKHYQLEGGAPGAAPAPLEAPR